MQLTYYNNKSDRRYVNKTLEQIALTGHSNPVNIVLVDDTDIVTPVFKMSDHDLYMTANYCYVDTLRRYYFIDDITLSEGYAFLHCTCDVLYTYRQPLLTRKAYIKRQENDYNMYMVDDKTKVLNYETLLVTNFPEKGFDATKQEFILGVVGNTTGNNS